MWLSGIHSVLASYQVSQQKEELCSHRPVHEKVLPMSLVEDVLNVLRIVLEYFGVPPDMVSAPTHTHTHFCYNYVTDSQTGIQGNSRGLTSSFYGSLKVRLLFLCRLACSWFQCGTVSCAVSIAALCGWLGPTSHWHLHHVSTSRYRTTCVF